MQDKRFIRNIVRDLNACLYPTSSPPKGLFKLVERVIRVLTAHAGDQVSGEEAGVVAVAGALLLIERIRDAGFIPTHKSLASLFFVGALLTCKTQDDHSPWNPVYARAIGVDLGDLNRKEVKFLTLLGWNPTAPAGAIEAKIEKWRG